MEKNIEKIDLNHVDWRSSREFFESLGGALERLDDKDESYNFTWVGKRKAIIEAGAPINKTLRPDLEASKDFENTKNMLIVGDNLDALKLLQESYLGKVKMIYIDPPYNTGHDFVYHDNFTIKKADYDDATRSEDGNVIISEDEFTENSKANGRFHSDWLSMMYPRLKLARNLLADDGVIFISIDDNEQANLKKLCDEVFGENNFLNHFVWINNLKGRQISNAGAAGTHESILCYCRNIFNAPEFAASSSFLKDVMPSSYKGFDYEIKEDKKGKYIITNELYNSNSAFNEITRPSLVFDIYYRELDGDIKFEKPLSEDYVLITPHKNTDGTHKYHAYRWSKKKIIEEKDDLEFIKNGGSYKIYSKRRDFDITTLKDTVTDISTSTGVRDIRELQLDKYFSFPKSVSLIEIFNKSVSDHNGIILDFFSGSGTTGHAVMDLNAEDGGNRQYICMQLDEKTYEKSEAKKAGYDTIDQITAERLRRAGDKIKSEHPDADIDTGFRVFRIDSSNEKENIRKPLSEINQTSLSLDVDNIKSDRSPLDLLFGVIYVSGLPFDLKLETREINGNTVYLYGYLDEGTGLAACFDDNISEDTIKEIAKLKAITAAFKDSSFANSSAKINLSEHFRIVSPDTKVKVL